MPDGATLIRPTGVAGWAECLMALRLSGLRYSGKRVVDSQAGRACAARLHTLVQFKTRTDHPVNAADQHHQTGFKIAVQRDLMHTV